MATVTVPQVQPLVAQPFWRTKQFGQLAHDVVTYGLLIILSLVFAFPFYWMVSASLKLQSDIFVWPPEWIPNPVVWQNYVDAFSNPQLPFLRFFVNTMILEVGIISGRLVSCVLVAYGFARLEAPGKNFLFAVLLATLMLPSAVTVIPRFILFNNLGWVNSFKPLIVPAWFGEAYAIFLMRQFFMAIPRELEEAAKLDGANTLDIILRVIIPISMPVLAVITVLSFKDIWNEFFTPLLYLNDSTKYTLAIGLAFFNGQFNVQWNLLMAASVVTLLPLIVVFFIAQKAFVEGISVTGLAGR
jgi:ABC-type glycerol-3-phosphate transport system permease component